MLDLLSCFSFFVLVCQFLCILDLVESPSFVIDKLMKKGFFFLLSV